jgi:hypothetical protein
LPLQRYTFFLLSLINFKLFNLVLEKF